MWAGSTVLFGQAARRSLRMTNMLAMGKAGQTASFETVLATAGGHNWSKEAIEVYKAKILREEPINIEWNVFSKKINRLDGIFDNSFRITLIGVLVLLLVATVAGAMWLINFGAHTFFDLALVLHMPHWVFGVTVGPVLLAVLVMGLIQILRNNLLKTCPMTRRLGWECVSVNMYHERHGALPEKVEITMRNVSTLRPGTQFEVWVLGDDPILDAIDMTVSDPTIWRPPFGHSIMVWDKDGKIVLPPAA